MSIIYKKTINKSYLFNVLKENKIFLLFSFFFCSLPIIFCLSSSILKPNGSQAVMGIGQIIPFLLSFMQISFTFAILIFSYFFKLFKSKKISYNFLISTLLWKSFLIGLTFSLFYIISSFLYMYFSNNRPNTQETLNYALNFLWFSSIGLIAFPIYLISIFIIKNNEEKSATILSISSFFIINISSFIFMFLMKSNNNGTIGLGIGYSFGIFISFIINFLYIKFFLFFNFYKFSLIKKINKSILKVIFKESFSSISISIFKAIAIIMLSFFIPDSINGFVPLSYQMSRVIWFNVMYFIPFLGLGIAEGIRYHYLMYHDENSKENCYLNHKIKNDLKIIIASIISTLIFSILSFLSLNQLIEIYTKNDFNTFKNGLMPEIKGWGSPKIFSNINLNTQTTTNNLYKLYEWLQQKNNEGISLLDFIENKYEINILEEIIKFLNNEKLSPNTYILIKNSLSYFMYLWLYSTTNKTIVESFLILRPLINFSNFFDQTNNNLNEIISNYSLSDVLTSLYLKINQFSAKAIIYIYVFGILNSVWSILLQIKQRNSKKSMPYLLLIFIYSFCISFLVTFGALFSVVLNEKLIYNPFKFLDAWTFPLLVISFLVIIIVLILNFISYKKQKKYRIK